MKLVLCKQILKFSIIFIAYAESKIELGMNAQNSISNLKALNDVVDEFFIGTEPFNILITEAIDSKYSDFLHKKFLRQNNEKFAYGINQMKEQDIFHTISAIIFVYSCLSYKQIHGNQYVLNFYSRPINFLVYVENCRLDTLKRNLKLYINQHSLSFLISMIEVLELLLIDDNDLLYLVSVEYFTEEACDEPQLKILNSFNKTTQKWNKKFQKYKKFRDFHGCELFMLASNKTSIWMDIKISGNSIEPFGLIPKMFELIAKHVNYEPKYRFSYVKDSTLFPCIEGFNEICVNKTNKNPNVCFTISRYEAQTNDDSNYLHFSKPFLEVREIVLTTPGDPYSSYEKLLLPFDRPTWILLISTFITAFLVIFLINFLPKTVQDVLYGNVKSPALNVISSFYGVPQPQIPTLSFPRFILMNFVLFCLIFRTCYQSKLFEFMTSTPRHPAPTSMKDLAERNYKVYVQKHGVKYTKRIINTDVNWPVLEFIDDKEFFTIILNSSQDSSSKLGIIVQDLMIPFEEVKKGRTLNWHQLSDPTLVTKADFAFYLNNFYLKVMDRVLNAWIPTGIMDKIVENFLGVKRKFIASNKPSILTVDKLSFGFTIWLGCCGSCGLVFAIEIGYFIIKSNLRPKNVKLRLKIRKIKFLKVHPVSSIVTSKDVEELRKLEDRTA
ncbi:unnamed protein product [Chironomus riparius]|uniref:Ionotropic receptor n=1 Tax=Chironomus riparius TaxID=315576 RepID=A0A9N9WPF6_9DIPT|nr:unnamed protein product [Chironomus riparius]